MTIFALVFIIKFSDKNKVVLIDAKILGERAIEKVEEVYLNKNKNNEDFCRVSRVMLIMLGSSSCG